MSYSNCADCNRCCQQLCPPPELKCVTCDQAIGNGGCGCCNIEVTLIPSKKFYAGTILGQRDSDGRYGAYDPTANNGLQTPRGVLKFEVDTNDKGEVYDNAYNMYGVNCPRLTTAMYICGVFRTEEIIGDLASAISTGLFGRNVMGPMDGPGLFILT